LEASGHQDPDPKRARSHPPALLPLSAVKWLAGKFVPELNAAPQKLFMLDLKNNT
jgi:hypothetical protein